MADVARAAKVTQATVSLALRGHARIPEETRRRIAAVAEKLGYRPDPLVSVLMAQRRRGQERMRGVLGVVSIWPDPKSSWLTNPFYTPYREGVVERAAKLGFRTDFFACDGSERELRVTERSLRARGIQAVVIAQAHESITRLPLDVSGLAAAYIGNGIREPRLSRVDAALDFDFRLAWRKTRERGHTRIGYATWRRPTLKNDGAWMGAYLHAQRELPEADRLPPLESEDMDRAALLAWADRWRPGAVLSENLWILDTLRAERPAIPLLCLAVVDGRGYSGVQVGRREIGAAAVDMVVAQLARGERGVPEIAKRVMIEGWWRDAPA